MGQSHRTRDIRFPRASNSKQESSQTSRGSYEELVTKGLGSILGVCNESMRFIEEHLLDDIKSFSILLLPLIRRNAEIMAKIKHWTHTSLTPPSSSCDHYGSRLDACNTNKPIRRRFIPSSSGTPIFPAGGLVMDAREVCMIWAACSTTRFQLSSFQWFRDTAGARHEYLLFKLESGESPACSHKEMWLRLERCPSNKARASKRALVGSLFGQFAADDLITLSPRREDLFRLECTSTVPQASAEFGQKLPLRYLVDVLDIIHKESPEYHIAGANCWFYASTIAEVVSKEARAVWKSGDISYLDHRKSKEVVNFEQYDRIMTAVRRLRGGLN